MKNENSPLAPVPPLPVEFGGIDAGDFGEQIFPVTTRFLEILDRLFGVRGAVRLIIGGFLMQVAVRGFQNGSSNQAPGLFGHGKMPPLKRILRNWLDRGEVIGPPAVESEMIDRVAVCSVQVRLLVG
jgi:hypothetical protein